MKTARRPSHHRLGIRCDHWLDFMDELNIGAFVADSRRRITAINLSAQALLGLREPEVINQDCREVFTGVPCTVSCVIHHPDTAGGQAPDLEVTDEENQRHLITRMATPIYNSQGDISGCMTILQDHSPITQLIDRLHYEERSLKIILNNLDVGIFTVNRGGLINFFNRAAETISGYDRHQVLGQSCAMIFSGERSPDVCLLKESIASGETRSSRQGRMTDKDGVTIPIRANYMALKNEKNVIVGGLATFHDMTLAHQLNRAISDRYTFQDMIGKDPAMRKIFEMVSVVAPSDATVLVEGATGTGKDLLAKVIHSSSPRATKPLVKVNCAAIPENLIESEIFGYVKGAFTGAERDKPGRFSDAEGGTIFLDEIGDLPLPLQAKLLRVLEDREFYPLGSRRTRKVDVRIISATNRQLKDLVDRRLFREDLFYRLNVVRIELPLLRERRGDLPLLIRHIARSLCAAKAVTPPAISETAMQILLNYNYPGNVRELENILEHALIICREAIIQPDHLPDYVRHVQKNGGSPKPAATPAEPHSRECQRILAALEKTGGHRHKAAQELGVERTTLWRKMKKYGIL
ncbi:MAG: sigma 54-interacting transcriptional regulator [Desulfosarcina sp.]|nr:sigma 54-interacting transcriptional regulator [Desulfosarcina sp.]MBC2741754.1 sigma 54-interacting transcriptional regulator [Desulfosarcina sp.]MBC2764668.1 sigma 54-interacting transcriptional regulator [Desulfosarcina sp.]